MHGEGLAMILVTGATGNVGREVVKLLLESGEEVGAVTRDPDSAAVPAGARVVGGDPSRPTTLTSALRDVKAVLLSPRAVGHGAAELLSLAGEHGAQRVVLLSAVTVQYPAGEARFAGAFKATEDVVRGCGMGAADPPVRHRAGCLRRRRDLLDPRARHRRGRRIGAGQLRTRRALLCAHRPAVTYPT